MKLQEAVSVAVLCLVCLFPDAVVGQPAEELPLSFGLSSPDSTQPVRAYQLPSWHWSQWRLDGAGGTEWGSRENDSSADAQFDTNLSLHPHYRGFWESEERSAWVEVSPGLDLGHRISSSSTDTTDEQSSNTSVSLSVGTKGSLKQYVGAHTFLFASGGGGIRYGYDRRSDADDGTRTHHSGDIALNEARVGIGLGRVRIVTPVIRALRVRERLRTVTQTRLSDQQVQTAAHQLARRPGYQSVYDRPDKLFWRDFFESVGITDQTPFETFYVADVLREPVGVRLEGADVRLGPLVSYEGYTDFTRNRSEGRGQVGGFLQGRLYRNVTLRHQLGAVARTVYKTPINGPVTHGVAVNLGAQWLWVIADRIRLTNRAQAQLSYNGRGQELDARETTSPPESPQWSDRVQSIGPLTSSSEFDIYPTGVQNQQRYRISSDFQFFIENSVSLTVGGVVRYRNGSRSRQDVAARMRFRIDYVLSRTLR